MPSLKRYLESTTGIAVEDVFTDIGKLEASAKEKIGYPTQKPLALLGRIIKASSNEGDVALDPSCGCATAQGRMLRVNHLPTPVGQTPTLGFIGPDSWTGPPRQEIPLHLQLADLLVQPGDQGGGVPALFLTVAEYPGGALHKGFLPRSSMNNRRSFLNESNGGQK